MNKIALDVCEAFLGTERYRAIGDARASYYYPVDLEFTLEQPDEYYRPLDERGLPMRHYRSVGKQYNPTRIAAFALSNYNRYYRTGDERAKEAFLAAADWFLDSRDGLWRYAFPWGDLQPGWISCMAQGEGVSVLVRAYRLTEDIRYLAQARRAVEPFTRFIGEGGVRSLIDGRHPFLEEYPSDKPKHTLNGFLYALIGLGDLGTVDRETAEPLITDLVETLATQWMQWDLGHWSSYDLSGLESGLRNPATVAYHSLHVTQMRHIGLVRQNTAILQAAERWANQLGSLPKRLRAIIGKIRYRVANPAQR